MNVGQSERSDGAAMRDERIPRRFGRWAGNPDGYEEDPFRCVEEIVGREPGGYQCFRQRGHGRYGAYCWQHAKQHPTVKRVTAQ